MFIVAADLMKESKALKARIRAFEEDRLSVPLADVLCLADALGISLTADERHDARAAFAEIEKSCRYRYDKNAEAIQELQAGVEDLEEEITGLMDGDAFTLAELADQLGVELAADMRHDPDLCLYALSRATIKPF